MVIEVKKYKILLTTVIAAAFLFAAPQQSYADGMSGGSGGGGGGGMGGVTITAAYVSIANGLDPADPAWSQASVATVTLQRFIDYVANGGGGGMGGSDCMMMGTSINRPVSVRAIHDGTNIYFRFEWADATMDTTVDDANLFGDAFAMEIPYSGTGSTTLAMGSQDEPVNIMFWRADLAAPQNIVAGGIGTPQPSPDAQDLQRFQQWDNGTWTVIVSRPLAGASANQITLTRGSEYRAAFANWDGSDKDRNGRKAISNWNTLSIQ